MRRSRTHAVADGLLGLVLEGTYPPTSALPSEADLAARFGVSRLTVREAIRSLASTNVIEVRHGKSSVINPPELWSPLDPRLLQARGEVSGQPDVLPRKLIEARRTIEIGVAELAARRRTDEQLHRLAQYLDVMRHAHALADVPRFVEADLGFHDTLFAIADNLFLDAVFEPLAEVMRTLRITTSSLDEHRQHAIDWHDRILAAVADGNPDEAREAMRAHLVQTEGDSDEFLTDHPGPSDEPTNPSPTAA